MARTPSQRPSGSLPAGRHGLSRAFVVDDQRSRLLDATVLSAAEQGFARMSVEDIVSRAGISRRTFYELFDNKLDAFLAAFDASAAVLLTLVRSGYELERGFERRVSSGLRSFLAGLAFAPDSARVCIVESLAAGPRAIDRRLGVMAEFARLITEDAHALPVARTLPATLAESLVGGIYGTVFDELNAGHAERLPALAPDLVYITLLPYVGERPAALQASRLRQELGRSQTFTFAAGRADR